MKSCFLHGSGVIAILALSLHLVECQVYSWTNQPGNIYNQPCNSDRLNFTWTYTPVSPDPDLIQWGKQNAVGIFLSVARYTGGGFTTDAAYIGRAVRIGNTTELGLKNPTSADDGTYRVTVTDGSGQTITSENVVVSTVTPTTLGVSGITATCGADRKTVTCAGVASLGTPGPILTLSYGSSSKDNRGTQTSVNEELTSPQTVTCSISGPATECLGAGVTKSASVACGVITTTTTTTTTTRRSRNPTTTTTTTTTTTPTRRSRIPTTTITTTTTTKRTTSGSTRTPSSMTLVIAAFVGGSLVVGVGITFV